MKILTVIGARPQFIKAAVLSRALANSGLPIREVLVHTGQHYDINMSEVFFEELEIPHPSYNLGVGGGSHGQNTGRMLEKLEELMQIEQPDRVLVYGDTDSTLAGALAASKLHIPVAHVEAGLRSFNRRMPEEINRVITDHISTTLFAPTESARKNLTNEGISGEKIHVTGDVMYDAALFYKARAVKPKWFDASAVEVGRYVLCTVHRAENTDSANRMRSIFQGLAETELPIILPLHPRTRGKLDEFKIAIPSNINITSPVGYLEMVWLEANCRVVATDSGGVQKEAYFHGKPCITLREETEWVELVEEGYNKVVGAKKEEIIAALSEIDSIVPGGAIYGVGDSAEKIVEILSSDF